MASTADFRNGLIIRYNNDLYSIIDFQHVKPGKGGAFVRTKLKNITTGRVIDKTFNAGVKIETVRVEHRQHQFLYNDDTGYFFMNSKTYEQLSVPERMISNTDFLKEGLNVDIAIQADAEEIPLLVNLPDHIEVEITYTEPGEKGNTASSNVLKPATIETGATINVPLFINKGETVKVDTRTGAYVERIKK